MLQAGEKVSKLCGRAGQVLSGFKVYQGFVFGFKVRQGFRMSAYDVAPEMRPFYRTPIASDTWTEGPCTPIAGW